MFTFLSSIANILMCEMLMCGLLSSVPWTFCWASARPDQTRWLTKHGINTSGPQFSPSKKTSISWQEGSIRCKEENAKLWKNQYCLETCSSSCCWYCTGKINLFFFALTSEVFWRFFLNDQEQRGFFRSEKKSVYFTSKLQISHDNSLDSRNTVKGRVALLFSLKYSKDVLLDSSQGTYWPGQSFHFFLL